MSLRSSISRLFGGAATTFSGSAYPYDRHVQVRVTPVELPQAAIYSVLRLFDLSNGVYDDLARGNVAIGGATASVRAIRNPIPAVCDAWQAKLWPEPLTIVSENAAIIEPLETVWRWSNWRASRPRVARWTALYGEAWIKVQASLERQRVWFEYIEPSSITDFEEDERGYVQYVRVDVIETEETDTGFRTFTHTETWSTAEQVCRIWVTDGDASGRRLRDLGAPREEIAYAELGIDFTPFVRIPFSDAGEKRALGAVQRALEPVTEADLSATNLHAVVYQDLEGAWVVESNGTDAAGRPLPPMRVAAAEPTYDALGRQTSNGTGVQSDGSVVVGKRSFWRLPGGYTMKSIVPDMDLGGALAILQDHDTALERLMPALAYARISEMSGGDLSGRAIRFKLTPFIDQVTSVRATALEKLEQADMMALTMGKAVGIRELQGIGEFDGGAFAHEFETRDIIPLSDLEMAEAEQMRAQAYQAWRNAGLPDAVALERLGYTRQEAARIVRLAADEAEQAMERQTALMESQEQRSGEGEEEV
jgi:hypothetical protein